MRIASLSTTNVCLLATTSLKQARPLGMHANGAQHGRTFQAQLLVDVLTYLIVTRRVRDDAEAAEAAEADGGAGEALAVVLAAHGDDVTSGRHQLDRRRPCRCPEFAHGDVP